MRRAVDWRRSTVARAPAVVVELEVAAAAVPVGEHPALAVATVDDELMLRRAVRVPVDDARDAFARAERRVDGAVLTSMIASGLTAVARRLPPRNIAPTPRRGE